ncbi:helix-hairpin-helix domain-containing protein [Aeromicrobium sp. CF4.19]|uniref:helix-hairpin-helix domain-containing protein n=1 Tax=Aeromicrobium sp. CF4.19 TaxID=3373082 RepID=UPI003EE78A7D
MSADRTDDAGQTRAEVARRRLAQLNASFHAVATQPQDLPEEPEGPAEEPVAATHRAFGGRRPSLRPVHLRVVATLGVAAGVVLTWWLLAERPEVAPVGEGVDLTSQGPGSTAGGEPVEDGEATGEVIIDVAGKVERPGIVVLPAGSRVHEAIDEAGGISGKVDTTTLNLARVLVDGEQVLVGVEPAAPSQGGSAGGGGSGDASGPQVNLNSATQEELETLPGVGPVTAESIITWRTENGRFSSVDDLLEVSGIGEKTLAELRERVAV